MVEVSPSLEKFRAAAQSQRVIAVWTRVTADLDTAVGLYQVLADGRPGTFLLESANLDGVWNRYSFIGVNSAATLTEVAQRAEWLGRVPVGVPSTGNPLTVIAETLQRLHTSRTDTPRPPDFPPFTSGLVGHLSYDAVRRLENLPDGNVDDLQLPEVGMSLVSDLAVLDHRSGALWLIANVFNFDDAPTGLTEAYTEACDRIEQMLLLLAAPRASEVRVLAPGRAELSVRRQRTSAQFQEMVRYAKTQIAAGEAYQIVLSQRFEVDLPAELAAVEIYRQLRLSNPSPYMYLLRVPQADGKVYDIVGSSPEALVTIKDRVALTHPIAGSKPRGATVAADEQLEQELLSDPKERAEHLMLVDLARNDLGRVCVPGSVEVVEFMQVRRFSHIMHLAATVQGQIAAGHDAVSVVLSCFPAGTLSGAPKVRAMEIIDDQEVTRRGLYGGIVGYFDFAGDADTAIAIRTGLIKTQADGSRTCYVQSGCGLVADSDPATEDQESINKAAAVVKAIQAAATQDLLRQ